MESAIPMEARCNDTSNQKTFTSKSNYKMELIQSFPIPKYPVVNKNTTICACAPLRCASVCLSFTKLTCPSQGYTSRRHI